ncbi:hypothetical protein [Cupriavidus nantongensis]|uniref:Uncharacterized protein n=1 Tax=Cupriavidus nantongensis TaxID=1796606 RepID=A0A142JGS6_9BURK|nr:hypothetical protein [Cupriavidus nantongensis]AMR77288.1 hypothetical protein A2G96_05830 [Cupriavidus nantongensis]
MTPQNIEKFDEIAGKIFAALYESFPVARKLDAKEFVEGGFDAAYFVQERTGLHLRTKEGDFFESTIVWLTAAGYIQGVSKEREPRPHDIILTPKGLEVLKAVPGSLTNSPTLGERMLGATKAGGKEVMRAAVKEALSLGIKMTVGG